MIFRTLFTFILFIVFSAVGFTQNKPDAETFLWKATKKGQPDTYLLGTLHIGKINSTLPPPYLEALKTSRQLIIESNPDDLLQPQHGNEAEQLRLLAYSQQTLNETLGKKRMDAIAEMTRQNEPPFHINGDSHIRPWMLWIALQTLYSPKGYSFYYGIDNLLIQQAKERNKTILSLEIMEPIYYLSNIPDDVLMRSLDMMITHQNHADKEQEILVSLYEQQQATKIWMKINDDQELLKFLPPQDYTVWKYFLHEQLLNERNQQWLKKLDDLLPVAPSLVAVGSGHLFGEKGLIQQLRLRGYHVEPILITTSQ